MTVSRLISVFFLIIATTGLVTNLYSWQVAREYQRRLETAKINGLRKLMADANVFDERVRLIIMGIFMYISVTIAAIDYPGPMPAELAAARACLAIICSLLTLKSIHNLKVHLKVVALQERKRQRAYDKPEPDDDHDE